jgi:hypothetical protein
VEHRWSGDAGGSDGAGPEGCLEAELDAEGGEADTFVLVPLRQRATGVGTPLADGRHLEHGADQPETIMSSGIDQRLRSLRIEDCAGVGFVFEVHQWLQGRGRARLETGGHCRSRIAIAQEVHPGLLEEASRGCLLVRAGGGGDRLQHRARVRVDRVGMRKPTQPDA